VTGKGDHIMIKEENSRILSKLWIWLLLKQQMKDATELAFANIIITSLFVNMTKVPRIVLKYVNTNLKVLGIVLN